MNESFLAVSWKNLLLPIQDFAALVWVHGATEGVDGRRTYYQGKSRIPAPLVVIRHHGASPLSLVASEILGLSKMDWNTFDLYTKMPATVQFSNQIARWSTPRTLWPQFV
jgi:hypothetical protein